MTNAEIFEMLKADAISCCENYVKVIKRLSHNDMHNVNKRIDLLEAYNKSVVSSAAYREFINTIRARREHYFASGDTGK